MNIYLNLDEFIPKCECVHTETWFVRKHHEYSILYAYSYIMLQVTVGA